MSVLSVNSDPHVRLIHAERELLGLGLALA